MLDAGVNTGGWGHVHCSLGNISWQQLIANRHRGAESRIVVVMLIRFIFFFSLLQAKLS
jgi:hypothetical protein